VSLSSSDLHPREVALLEKRAKTQKQDSLLSDAMFLEYSLKKRRMVDRSLWVRWMKGGFLKSQWKRHLPRIERASMKRARAYSEIMKRDRFIADQSRTPERDYELTDLWLNGWYKFQGSRYRKKVEINV